MKKLVLIGIFLASLVSLVALSGTAKAATITSCGTIIEDSVLDADLASTGTCLTIGADSIILDCAGRSITGDKTLPVSQRGYGIYSYEKSGVTIKNCVVKSFLVGIFLDSSNSNILIDNDVSNNVYGIYLAYSSYNNLTNNTASNGYIGINLHLYSNSNTLIGNTANSNSWVGIWIFLGPSNNTLRGNTANLNISTGIFLMDYSNNNTLIDNTANLNGEVGIWLELSNSNILIGNTTSNNWAGIFAQPSNGNILTGNTVSNNEYGIYLSYSSNNNLLLGNTVNSNTKWGITLGSWCNSNILVGNTLSNNDYGIYLWRSNNNKVYNNNFIDNTTQAYVVYSSDNVFNLDKPIGGNYWSDYDTPAEDCNDMDNDGFCDDPYLFTGGQDNLPWTKPIEWTPLESFTEVIEYLDLPQGIETSLISMIDNAQKALDKGNEKAAVSILQAFIKYVEAQSGKKISEEDAEMLIDYAENIIAQIGGEDSRFDKEI